MASIYYKINGKADNSAINSAKKGIESLGKVASNVQKILTGFLALKGIQAIGKGVSESLEAYKTQQKAMVQLTQAVSNNANLTSGSLQNLISLTKQLQATSIYSDDELQTQASILAGMGLTEQQIKDTLKAATELSSAGIGNLESNVKNLAKTFGGMTGELGEVLPGLKNMSKEALQSGEAIKYVAAQYAGFAQNLADNTLEGKEKKISNIINDLKEKAGALAAIGKIALFDNLEPVLEELNANSGVIFTRIANFFINLPEIAKISFETITSLGKAIFSWDYFKTLISSLAKYIFDVFTAVINWLVSVVAAIGTTIWEPLKYGFETLALGVKNVFATIINAIITRFNG